MTTIQSPKVLSNARAYFNYINSQTDPFRFLSHIPSSFNTAPVFEKEWLDFKSNPQNEKDAKKIWSKALSGYANITDGLIIWGIDARKVDGIDAAYGLRLIPDPNIFQSNLRDWIRDATNPPVMNVDYRSYSGPNNSEGFVVCFIPQSTYRPHRAEVADKQYYFRAGDDFLIAEPGLLRTLFYPDIHPSLAIEAILSYQLSPGALAIDFRKSPPMETLVPPDGFQVTRKGAFGILARNPSSMSLEIRLNNTGKVSAKDVYAILETDEKRIDVYEGEDWRRGTSMWGTAACYAKRAFHPGEVIRLLTIGFQQKFENKVVDETIIPKFSEIGLQISLYAENYQGQKVSVSFMPEDLNFETYSATKIALPEIESNP